MSSEKEIGCDIESVDRKTNRKNLLYHVLSTDEKAFYHRLDEEEMNSFFYHSWTLKEAFVKAIGAGFRAAPATLSFTHKVPVLQDHAIKVGVKTNPHDPIKQMYFQTFLPKTGYIASIASKVKPILQIHRIMLRQGKFLETIKTIKSSL